MVYQANYDLQSTFTSKIIGEAVKSEHHMSMLRYLVPSKSLLDNPETKEIFKEGLTKLRIILGQNKSMAMYGCRQSVPSSDIHLRTRSHDRVQWRASEYRHLV